LATGEAFNLRAKVDRCKWLHRDATGFRHIVAVHGALLKLSTLARRPSEGRSIRGDASEKAAARLESSIFP